MLKGCPCFGACTDWEIALQYNVIIILDGIILKYRLILLQYIQTRLNRNEKHTKRLHKLCQP